MEAVLRKPPVVVALSAAVGVVVGGLGLWLYTRLRRAYGGRTQRLGTLYHRTTAPTARCLWLLQELDAVDCVTIEPVVADAGTPEDVTSRCRLVLTNGAVFSDSVAICLYIADVWQRFLPESAAKADYYNWSVYAGNTVDGILRPLSHQIYKVGEDQRDLELVTSLTQQHSEYMEALEAHLADKLYVCGKKFTAADIVLGYSVFWSSTVKGGQLLVNSPNVRAYLDRLKSRKVFSRSIGSTRDWLMTMS